MSSFDSDPVARAMHRFSVATAATVVAPDVDVIIGRARAHRRANAAVAGLAALVAVALTVTLMGPWPVFQSSPVNPPASQRPSPSDEPMYPRTVAPLDPVFPVPTSLLEPMDFSPDTRLGRACAGQPVEVFTTVGRQAGDDAVIHVGLWVYADEPAARTAFAEMRPDLATCVAGPQPNVITAAQPVGEEALSVQFPRQRDGAGELTGMPERVVAARQGAEVVTVYSGPEIGDYLKPRIDAASVATLVAVARDILTAERICPLVCPRPSGLPEPIDPVAAGQAWVVVLQVLPTAVIVQAEVRAAAEIGYRPLFVAAGCDEGADPVVAVSPTAYYLALYFADADDADAVVTALQAHDPTPGDGFPVALPVITRCLR